MSKTKASPQVVGRRGELLAELFLQELGALFVAHSAAPDVGIDFFVGFTNARGGINVAIVEVKATEHAVGERFRLSRRTYELLSQSNIPGLLLVADVKQNRLYYALPQHGDTPVGRDVVTIPLREATPEARHELSAALSQ